MLTSGISAEYGRFTGGVVNAITKSGGNTFSGSCRVNFLNPSWTTETPFEKSRTHVAHDRTQLQQTLRRHLRRPDRPRPPVVLQRRPLRVGRQRRRRCRRPASRSSQDDTNKRGEIKLTGTVAAEPHDPGRLPEQPAHE